MECSATNLAVQKLISKLQESIRPLAKKKSLEILFKRSIILKYIIKMTP